MNKPVTETRSWSYLSQLSVNYFGWIFCWHIASAYIVPNVLLTMVDDSVKNARLGLMIGISNILVLILVPLAGTISDRMRSRLGRRRPFYFSATVAVSIFILFVVPSRYYAILFALMVLMHVAEAFWFPNYALLRDVVPLERRGRISALTNIASTFGLLLAHIISPTLVTSGRMMLLALVAVTANISCNFWVAFAIKEDSLLRLAAEKISSWREVYVPKLNGSTSLAWLAAVNLLTQMGTVAMTCFLLYFIKDQIDADHFNETFRNVNLIGTTAAVFSAIAAGWIADRFGRKKVLVVACVLQIISMLHFLVLPWVHTTLYLSGFFFGLGNAAYWSLYWTMLSDLVPDDEISKYIGLVQYTSIIPWMVVPPTLGAVVDYFGAASGQGYRTLFTAILMLLIGGMAMIRKIPETLKAVPQTATSDAS